MNQTGQLASNHFSGPLIVSRNGRSLDVVRCRRYLPGLSEDRGRDGAAQMRLPLGEWIVGLREATAPSAG